MEIYISGVICTHCRLESDPCVENNGKLQVAKFPMFENALRIQGRRVDKGKVTSAAAATGSVNEEFVPLCQNESYSGSNEENTFEVFQNCFFWFVHRALHFTKKHNKVIFTGFYSLFVNE